MAIHQVDSLAKALKIVEEVALVRKRWGKQAKFNYTEAQLVDAVVLLHAAYEANAVRFGEIQAEEHANASLVEQNEELRAQLTKANRQLAAANARAARADKKLSPSEIVLGVGADG